MGRERKGNDRIEIIVREKHTHKKIRRKERRERERRGGEE